MRGAASEFPLSHPASTNGASGACDVIQTTIARKAVGHNLTATR